MAYTVKNYKHKKQVKEAVAAGVRVEVYQPGPFGPAIPDGRAYLEGPHYPAPHTWYAEAVVEDGAVVSVK